MKDGKIQIPVGYSNTSFIATVGTRSSATVLSFQDCLIETNYLLYNRRKIKVLGSLFVHVSSLGWKFNLEAQFLRSEIGRGVLFWAWISSQKVKQATQLGTFARVSHSINSKC